MNRKVLGLISIIICIFAISLLPSSVVNKSTDAFSEEKNSFKVHFIDVGQGDSILITVNNKTLLIDSGPKDSENQLLSYIREQNIKKFDYVIATHPHEDHIGNMDKIIYNYTVGAFYSPKVTTTSKTFEDMVESLLSKNMKINVLKAGTSSMDLGDNTSITIFSPNKTYYENLNNYSPIIRITYGNTSFVFTGDAEIEIENEVLSTNPSLKSDVLKLGHHGSKTSTSENFFKAIDPSITVISCGRDNKYNHPSTETKDLLKKHRPKCFRTDLDGTIVLESNGYEIRRTN